MELITIFGVVLTLIWLSVTAILLHQYFNGMGDTLIWNGSLMDWLMTVLAFTLGPFFIVTGASLALATTWAGMMLFEGTGVIVYLLSKGSP